MCGPAAPGLASLRGLRLSGDSLDPFPRLNGEPLRQGLCPLTSVAPGLGPQWLLYRLWCNWIVCELPSLSLWLALEYGTGYVCVCAWEYVHENACACVCMYMCGDLGNQLLLWGKAQESWFRFEGPVASSSEPPAGNSLWGWPGPVPGPQASVHHTSELPINPSPNVPKD